MSICIIVCIISNVYIYITCISNPVDLTWTRNKSKTDRAVDLRRWRWMDFVPLWPTWPWRHEFITRSSADMASLKRFEACMFMHFLGGLWMMVVFFQTNCIICSTSSRMDVLHQLKWMLKVLNMMLKVLKLLFLSHGDPGTPIVFARCLLRSLPVVKSRPRQNSAGRRWWLSQPKTSKVLIRR